MKFAVTYSPKSGERTHKRIEAEDEEDALTKFVLEQWKRTSHPCAGDSHYASEIVQDNRDMFDVKKL